MNPTELEHAHTNARIRAALARMETRERRATGEPCRCPEQLLRCECGAYTEAVAEFEETCTDRYEVTR
jgi:hypothetical protein